jgi:1,4-alpha-glucan branching enzyme
MSTGTNHSTATSVDPLRIELEQLVAGEHGDPHHLLGVHADGDATVVRGYRPDAEAMAVVLPDGQHIDLEREHAAGVFSGSLKEPVEGLADGGYQLEVRYPGGTTFTFDDPYRFWPTIGELDLHLIGEGRHELMWCNLGAHLRTHQGVAGTSFVVWAPNARGVRVVGDFNSWDGRLHPMRRLGTSGLWELFLPAVQKGDKYKY